MALTSGSSGSIALILCVLTFSMMQLFKEQLSAGQLNTILGGFVGSWFFIFLLTAVGNLGTFLFGKGYQARIFPEILFCVLVSVVASATVHRVCATVCLIFSLIALYYINQLSQKTYGQIKPKELVAKTSKGRNK